MIKNLNTNEIKKDEKLKQSFINAKYKDFNINCNIFEGDFFLDSFNYFPITKNLNTFSNLFTRDINLDHDHFFTQSFYSSFKKDKENFKSFNKIFLLGSSAADNYYSNLLQFLPRLFFINEKKIKIGIHRNSSLKLRKFIERIFNIQNVEFVFVYLDDNFYSFKNSKFPQFFNIKDSSVILRKFLKFNNNVIKDKKIYITRENSSYRSIVNESDIIPMLRSNGFKIINPNLYEIDEQIEIFSGADEIIGPHGSNLANIVFCKPGTKIYEIGPKFENNYEKFFENRYKNLSDINSLKYSRIITDTVDVENHSELAEKYINKKILNNSNYYKNLIVKIKDFELLLN